MASDTKHIDGRKRKKSKKDGTPVFKKNRYKMHTNINPLNKIMTRLGLHKKNTFS